MRGVSVLNVELLPDIQLGLGLSFVFPSRPSDMTDPKFVVGAMLEL
jgi:hypothetical protein